MCVIDVDRIKDLFVFIIKDVDIGFLAVSKFADMNHMKAYTLNCNIKTTLWIELLKFKP